MKGLLLHWLKIIVPAFCLVPQVIAGPVSSDVLTTPDLIKALQSGGHIIYMRHGPTDLTQIDVNIDNFDDCESQRNLTAKGRFVVQLIGKKISALGIPVASVSASPYCRCRETARLAFGQYRIEPDLRFSTTEDNQEATQLGERLYTLMMNSPVSSANTVYVGHSTNLKAGLGIWPKPEGVVVVFQKRAHELVYRGMIAPDAWPSLGELNNITSSVSER